MEKETCIACGGSGMTITGVTKDANPDYWIGAGRKCDTCDGEGTVPVMPQFPAPETTPDSETIRRIEAECARARDAEMDDAWHAGARDLAQDIIRIIREGRE